MVSLENLLIAWDEFKIGKRNKKDVQIFEYNLEDNLFKMQQNLINKTYQHSPYSEFFIRDPKLRHIHKATVQDRIIHHLIHQTINPAFEPAFIFDSYSCRKEKGTHKAIKRLENFARKVFQTHKKCFVLKCDIKKFFENIEHKILFQIIRETIKDEDVLWLIREIINSFNGGNTPQNAHKGLPIGNLTSQLFANIYMNEFDQYMKHRLKVKHYIRYTDDFAILHHNPDYLQKLKNKIEIFLKNDLSLSLHDKKTKICKLSQGIDFLGYVQLPYSRTLRAKTKRRMFKKLKNKIILFKQEKISEQRLMQTINSYLGILIHGNCYKLQQNIYHQVWTWIKEIQ